MKIPFMVFQQGLLDISFIIRSRTQAAGKLSQQGILIHCGIGEKQILQIPAKSRIFIHLWPDKKQGKQNIQDKDMAVDSPHGFPGKCLVP